MAKTYEFEVEGEGHFPFDMLRYDTCWPAKEQEVHLIPRRDTTARTIHIRSIKKPTVGRWNSFGWKVNNLKEIR